MVLELHPGKIPKKCNLKYFWKYFHIKIKIGFRIDHAHYRPKWVDKIHETWYDNTELSLERLTAPEDISIMNSPKSLNTTMDKHLKRVTLLLDFAKKCGITNAEIEGHQDKKPTKKDRKSLINTVKVFLLKLERHKLEKYLNLVRKII